MADLTISSSASGVVTSSQISGVWSLSTQAWLKTVPASMSAAVISYVAVQVICAPTARVAGISGVHSQLSSPSMSASLMSTFDRTASPVLVATMV